MKSVTTLLLAAAIALSSAAVVSVAAAQGKATLAPSIADEYRRDPQSRQAGWQDHDPARLTEQPGHAADDHGVPRQ